MKTILTAALIAAMTTSAGAGVITCERLDDLGHAHTYTFGPSWAIADFPALGGKVDYTCDEDNSESDGWGDSPVCYNLRSTKRDPVSAHMLRLIDGPRIVVVMGSKWLSYGSIAIWDVACTGAP